MFSVKKLCALSLAVVCVLTGVMFSTDANAAKGFKNLSFMGSYTERHPTVLHAWTPWFAATEKATNGQLSFNYFGSNSLYPEKESFDAVSDGRVDMGVVRASLYPGAMNLITSVDIPGMAPNAIVGGLVAQDLIDKFPEVVAEFPPNSVPWTVWASAAYQLHTIKPVKSLAELKGKKLIVWDSIILEVAQALGANPIRLTSTDTYMALSKGMADGVICPLAPFRSFKLTDVATNHTILNLGVGTFNMFIYKPLWDEMPQELRDYLTTEGGAKMSLTVGQSLEDGALVDTKWMAEQGHTFIYPDEATMQTFLAPLAEFKTNWVKAREAEGSKNAKDVLAYTEERVKFHTEEMKKGAYGNYKM